MSSDTRSALWSLGMVFYFVEVLVVGFASFLFGGLSVMASDGCSADNVMRICSQEWQSVMTYTATGVLVMTVIAMSVLMGVVRELWTLGLAIVLTILLPIVAFVFTHAIVTA
ncbi:hypothetical protein [Dietzia sp. NCCP-2495]|uniref:hypothetical protein n=1 Tax=Dietzia sp. NCCP-2495 TaxID=2934675 RepID=UPI0022302D9A|nr:hypothetical protein [Dietzia sp. NCCP-2495]